MNQRIKASLAELIGTFTLCFLGAGSIIIDAHTGGGVGLLGIAAAHGLGLAIAVTATMNISGGQINPAVTIGLMVIKKIKPGDAVFYIVAQLTGASLAGLVLLLFPGGSLRSGGTRYAEVSRRHRRGNRDRARNCCHISPGHGRLRYGGRLEGSGGNRRVCHRFNGLR